MTHVIDCGCIGCTVETGRSPGCHGSCEKYKKFREQMDNVNRNRKIEAEKYAYFYGTVRRHKK